MKLTGDPADMGKFRSPSLRHAVLATPHFRDSMILGNAASEAEMADYMAFLESLTDAGFLTNSAYGDPWRAGHPAQTNPVLP